MNSMKLVYLRYAGLMLLTGLGGIVSGFLWLIPNGLMAGALGASLSAGTAWLGMKQLRDGSAPGRASALATGAVAGLLGGVLMAVISAACASIKRHEFSPPILPTWVPVAMGLLYGLVLLGCYYGRLGSKHPLGETLLRASGLCFILKAVATFVFIITTEWTDQNMRGVGDLAALALSSCIISLLGAVPFALFWVLANRWLDPAWNPPSSKICDGN